MKKLFHNIKLQIKTYIMLHRNTAKLKRKKWEEDKQVLETIY